MTKINVYSSKGVKKSGTNLPKALSEKINLQLLAQAIRVYENRIHQGLSRTKTRGEVSVSTRKIYRQKGTGMARHGAKSAPIFVGGGITHGPDGLKRNLNLPKKMKNKAFAVSVSLKADEGKFLFVENLDSLKKTKEAVSLINKISEKEKDIEKNTKLLVALSIKNQSLAKVLNNIENVTTKMFSDLNAYDVYKAGAVLVDKDALSEEKAKKSGEKEMLQKDVKVQARKKGTKSAKKSGKRRRSSKTADNKKK